MTTLVYTFHTFEKATIAAIEYVIRKYKYESWFNGALSKTVNVLYHNKDSSQLFKPPLVIHKDNNDTLYHRQGYHYVISDIESYNQYFNKTNVTTRICLFLILFNLMYLVIGHFLKNNNDRKI